MHIRQHIGEVAGSRRGDIQSEDRGSCISRAAHAKDAAGRACRGIEQRRIRRVERKEADAIRRIIRGNEFHRAAGRFEVILPIERGRLADAEQRILLGGNIGLNLGQTGAGLLRRGEIVLDRVHHGDRGLHRRGHRRNHRLALAERAVDRAEGADIGIHLGRDRPIGGVIGGAADGKAGRYLVFRCVHIPLRLREGLKCRHRGCVGQ